MKRPDRDTIRRVLDERATPQEAREVARWFSSAEGAAELSRLIDEEARMLETGERMPASGIPSEAIYRRIRAALVRRRRRRIALRVAAVLIPCLLVLGVGIRLDRQVGGIFSAPEYAEIYVPKGERMQMVFQDGTRVWLNADTRLRYPEKFGFSMRRVELDGEAYFEVAHNEKLPFRVEARDCKLTVLGTKFNVSAYEEDPVVQTALMEGSLRFESERARETMTPGDLITYHRASGCVRRERADTEQFCGWIDGIIRYDAITLPALLRKLAREHAAEIELRTADFDTKTFRISLTKAQDIESILNGLCDILPISVQRDGNSHYVYSRP